MLVAFPFSQMNLEFVSKKPYTGLIYPTNYRKYKAGNTLLSLGKQKQDVKEDNTMFHDLF